jgi:hypothetical protein
MYLVFVGAETNERDIFGFLDEAVEYAENELAGLDVHIEDAAGNVVWDNHTF